MIGIGTDIISVDRVRKLARRDEAVFLQRVFGAQEREYLLALPPGPRRWTGYALHIAAKESVFKALQTGLRDGMKWSDVQVIHTGAGPRLRVSGETEGRFKATGV